MILSLCFLFICPPVNAHLGGGPPFVQIDGKYAQSNPVYQGESIVHLPQDLSPDTYVVNSPIVLSVDIPALTRQTTIPAAMAKDLTFRWSYALGENFEKRDPHYQQGSKTSYSFTKPGSYLIILEGKSPLDASYLTLDTVQIDVVPHDSYLLPKPAMFIGTDSNNPTKPVVFVSKATVDSSTRLKSVLWDFGDIRLSSGKQATHTFSDLDQYGIASVINRVIDQNGIIADVAVKVENVDSVLSLKPLATSSADLITIGKSSDVPKEKNMTWILVGAVLVVIVLAGFFVFRFFAKNT